MEGRWTIVLDSHATGFTQRVEGPGHEGTPVVPCDDAAVERVAAELARQRGWVWAALSDRHHAGTREALRDAATAVLRAAGETP